MLHAPSADQKKIIKDVKKYNIIVDSVAGSGKTTTILSIAKKYKDKRILLLTYNSKLRLETKNRIINLKLMNIDCYTYHAFFNEFYNTCTNDIELYAILQDNVIPRLLVNYDILVLDEAQDIRPILYRTIYKIYLDNMKFMTFCVIGDKYQNIYQYQNADYRFLTIADKIFNWNDKPWKSHNLHTSHRLTKEMSTFVNDCIIQEDRIKSEKDLIKNTVMYSVFDFHNYCHVIVDYIENTLKNGYKPEDFLICSYSVKKGNKVFELPNVKLSNMLSDKGYKVFYPNNDSEEILNNDLLKGKFAFSSFHQSKGIEKKIVIVLGFDNHLEYYSPDFKDENCPNILYVATTRATDKMLLLQGEKSDNLNCVCMRSIKKNYMYTEMMSEVEKHNKGIKRVKICEEEKVESSELKKKDATTLLNHMSIEVIMKLIKFVQIKTIHQANECINIDTVVDQFNNTYESVSDIIGSVIPMMIEMKYTKKVGLMNEMKNIDIVDPHHKKNVKDMKIPYTIKDLISLILLKELKETKNKARINQMKNRNFINANIVETCVNSVDILELDDPVFEPLITRGDLACRIDCIDNHRLFEFKCVKELKIEHIIQVCIYMWIIDDPTMEYYLFNIFTGNLIRVILPYDYLDEFMATLRKKNDDICALNDAEFVEFVDSILD